MIPELLQRKLTASGLTQAELARRLNVAPQHVNDWLRGRRQPRAATLDRILRVLDRAVKEPAP